MQFQIFKTQLYKAFELEIISKCIYNKVLCYVEAVCIFAVSILVGLSFIFDKQCLEFRQDRPSSQCFDHFRIKISTLISFKL